MADGKKEIMTTDAGRPVGDNQNSLDGQDGELRTVVPCLALFRVSTDKPN